MRKLLVLLGAIALTTSSVSGVVACGSTNKNKVENPPETKETLATRAESLRQVQSYVLADAYGLDLKKTVKTVDYAFDQDKIYFNAGTLSGANLAGMNITGTRGSDAEFLIQLVKKINIPGIGNIGEIIIPGVGKIKDLLNKSRELIAAIPLILDALPLEQYLCLLPSLINNIGDKQFLPIDPGFIAEGIAAAIARLYRDWNIDSFLTSLNAASDLSELADLSIAELQSSFFTSLTTTIGYGLYPTTFTSLVKVEGNVNVYDPAALTSQNYDAAMKNFFTFLIKKEPLPTENYAPQAGGMVFYLVKTIKILETLISVYDDNLQETFVINGGDHLFSATMSNADYLDTTKTKKVNEFPLSEKGLHFEYLLSKIGYFFNNQNEEDGYRVLKLINILVASGGYGFDYLESTILDLVEAINPDLVEMIAEILPPILNGIIKQVLVPFLTDGVGDPSKILAELDEEVQERIILLVRTLIEMGVLPPAVSAFLQWLYSDAAKIFFNHSWTNLYFGDWNDLAAIFGKNFNAFSDAIDVDQLNLHALLNQATVRHLMVAIVGQDFDLGQLSDVSLDGLISTVVNNFAIKNQTSEGQKGNVLPIDIIKQMIKLFLEKNYINDDYNSANQSLLRQLINNINHWTKFLPLLGYESETKPGMIAGHTYVYSQSILGQLVYLFSPALLETSDPEANDGKGELLDLNTTRSDDNHWDVCSGINKTLANLLNGTDYAAFVVNQAENAKAWVIDKIYSNYDATNKILLNQTYELSFSGSDFELGQMKIRGVTHRYQVTYARTNQAEKFSFKKLIRLE